jgi:NADH-quinone oxidoreductase subunit F
LPIDYEKLAEAGSIMGSGGLIVMDEDTCMVDVARYFVEFLRDESCGKCTACREGLEVMHGILTRICAGNGTEADIELLEELSHAVRDGSLCGLGKTAPNPVLSTLRYFRNEYEDHIVRKRCTAAVCKGIISSPCQHTCPLHQDVPCYIGLIAQGRFDEAVEIVRRENPLPAICGRVCTAPCEAKCRSGEGGGQPISIRALKRFLADYEREQGLECAVTPKETRPERVAIVGSGPGGLTCAHYLALEGYQVTIFESLPVAGGMLATGIPDYRLPKEILDCEIDRIKQLGVAIRTNTTVGKDIQFADLKQQYRAVFIATGAHKGLKLDVEGEDHPQVVDAVEFLRAVNLGHDVTIGDRVAVIGGGDAAVDAARVARRMGRNVTILYRRTRTEMPAAKEEVDAVLEEGIEIRFLVAPIRVLSDNGRLTGLECMTMRLGTVDKSGRRRSLPMEAPTFVVEVDTLIPAIGQEPDLGPFADENELTLSEWGTIAVNPGTFQTGVEGVFAGGDVVTGPSTVVDAMAHGKIAARMIHDYIDGRPVKREYGVTQPAIDVAITELTDDEIAVLRRPDMPEIPPPGRTGNFKEVQMGLTAEAAIAEAKRCVRCDVEAKEWRKGTSS